MPDSNELLKNHEVLPEIKYSFFVGGNDLEMSEIKRLLAEKELPMSDNNLSWGAKASVYKEQIAEAIKRGEVPVLIELDQDVELPKDANAIIIDHHGKRSAEPASILQICKLLNIDPSRRIELIAANDAGWIPKLRAIGATNEEIRNIREEDRKAQGFDTELEEQSEVFAKSAKIIPELGLAIVDKLPISRFSGIKDRIALEKDIYNIVSIARSQKEGQNGEMEFQGDGEICSELNKQFQGWSGGDGLGQKGGVAFWGGYPDDPNKVVDYVKNRLYPPKPKYSTENAEEGFVDLSEDANKEAIRKIVGQLEPRDQIKFFHTLTVDPIRVFRRIRTLGTSGRRAIMRNAAIAADIIIDIQGKRKTPFEAVTKDITENLPNSLTSESVLANLQDSKASVSVEIKHESSMEDFSSMLNRIDALKQLMLFRGMIVAIEESKREQSTYEGKGTGYVSTLGTGRYWYELQVPVGIDIVRFKLSDNEEPTNQEFKESPETWLSAIERTCNELTSERIQETLAKAVETLALWTSSEAVGDATRERIALLKELAEKAEANISQYAHLLQKNKAVFESPKAAGDWKAEKAEFLELMGTIGKWFKDAHIIIDSGKEKVVGAAPFRDYNDQVVLGWFKKYEEITYPFSFIDRINHSGNKHYIPSGGYIPKGLINLRAIELDLLKLQLQKSR